MKALSLILVSVFVLSACSGDEMAAWIPAADKTPMTTSAKLKACSLDEARVKVQDGSVWSTGIQATAQEIGSSCVKKLALQSAGVDQQATSDAYNSLQSLMGAAKGLATGTTAQ